MKTTEQHPVLKELETLQKNQDWLDELTPTNQNEANLLKIKREEILEEQERLWAKCN